MALGPRDSSQLKNPIEEPCAFIARLFPSPGNPTPS